MKQEKKGFTLIELMVVISIIGILSAIALPNLVTAIQNYGLLSAARDMASILRKGRSVAIKENRTVVIKFDLDSAGQITDGRYVFDAESNKRVIPESGSLGQQYAGGVHFGFGNATKGASSSGKLPSAPVSFQSHKITFNSMGLCTAGYVYLANRKGGAFAVGANSTGLIMYKKWNGSDWN